MKYQNLSQYKPGQVVLLALLTLALNSCDFGIFPKGSSTLKNSVDRLQGVRTVTVLPENARTHVHFAALSIGQDMINDMAINLKGLGLSDSQVQVITASAENALEVQVSALSIPGTSLALADDSSGTDTSSDTSSDTTASAEALVPVMIAAAPVIEGAMIQLNNTEVGLPDPEKRSTFAGGIMGSTLTSLNGNTAELSPGGVARLTGTMVASAVGRFKEAGLTDAAAALGAKAVTQNAIGAIATGGFATKQEDILNVSSAMVGNAISSLSSDIASDEFIAEAAGKATAGAIVAVATVGLSQDAGIELVGEMANSSMGALATLPIPEDVLVASVSEISTNAVESMDEANFSSDNLGGAIAALTGGIVSAFGDIEIDDSIKTQSAAAVASGAMSGLSGISTAGSTAGDLVGSVISGTVGSLGAAGMSQATVASSVGNVVGAALTSFASAGISSSETRDSAMKSIISSSVSSFASAGITDASSVSVAMKNMSKKATESLPDAGFSAAEINDAVQAVAKTSIESVQKAASSTSSISSLLNDVSEGMSRALGNMQKSGSISSDVLASTAASVSKGAMEAIKTFSDAGLVKAADLGTLSQSAANSIFQGFAISGAASSQIAAMQASVTKSMSTSLTTLGASAETISAVSSNIATSATNATTLADQVAKGFDKCSVAYADSLSNDVILAKITAAGVAPFCARLTSEKCPKSRLAGTRAIAWVDDPGALTCEGTTVVHQFPAPGPFALGAVSAAFAVQTPTFKWAASTNAVSFSVVVSSDAACSNVLQSSTVTEANKTLDALGDGTYYICVDAINANGKRTKASNSPYQFKILATPPGSFTAFFPILGNNSQPTITWSPSAGASLYRLGISTNQTCSNLVQTYPSLTGTQVALTSKLSDGTYYVCMSALDDAGNETHPNNPSIAMTIDTVGPVISGNRTFTGTGPTQIQGGVADVSGISDVHWVFVDGPSGGSFADPKSLITTFNASVSGTYRVRLVATDTANNPSQGELVTINWSSATQPVVQSFTAVAGTSPGTIRITVNLNASRTGTYSQVAIFRTSGSSPANCSPTGFTYSIPGSTTGTNMVFDDSVSGSTVFSYKACVYGIGSTAPSEQYQVASVTASAGQAATIFVTSMPFDQNMIAPFINRTFTTGLEGADFRCEYLAGQAGLPQRNWKMIAGGISESARERITITGDVYNLKPGGGELVATASNFWTGNLQNAVRYNEKGEATPYYQVAGFSSPGSSPESFGTRKGFNETCNGYSTNQPFGTYVLAHPTSVDSSWGGASNISSPTCSYQIPYYCISQGPFTNPLSTFTAATPTYSNTYTSTSTSTSTNTFTLVTGDVALHLQMPADTSNYGTVQIRRSPGVALPASNCTQGTVIASLSPGIGTWNHLDHTGGAGYYSYIACVYNASGALSRVSYTFPVKSYNDITHEIFVTQGQFSGNMNLSLPPYYYYNYYNYYYYYYVNGIQGADGRCQLSAESRGLPGNWKAILSTDNEYGSAHQRFGLAGSVSNLNNQGVASSQTDLFDGSIFVPVGYSEWGLPSTNFVMTGSTATGDTQYGFNCSSYQTGYPYSNSILGRADQSDGRWLFDSSGSTTSGTVTNTATGYAMDGTSTSTGTDTGTLFPMTSCAIPNSLYCLNIDPYAVSQPDFSTNSGGSNYCKRFSATTCGSHPNCTYDSYYQQCVPQTSGRSAVCGTYSNSADCSYADCTWDSLGSTCYDANSNSECSQWSNQTACTNSDCQWYTTEGSYCATKPPACSTYVTHSSCDYNSCYWNWDSSSCSSTYTTPSSCSVISDQYACSTNYCYWNSNDNSCSSTPMCSYGDYNSCNYYGCQWDWNTNNCSVSAPAPASCSVIGDQYACSSEPGCMWNGSACASQSMYNTSTDCATFPDLNSCNLYSGTTGCFWNGSLCLRP